MPSVAYLDIANITGPEVCRVVVPVRVGEVNHQGHSLLQYDPCRTTAIVSTPMRQDTRQIMPDTNRAPGAACYASRCAMIDST